MGTESITQIIFGIHPVLEALRSERSFEKLYVAQGRKSKAIQDVIALARSYGVEIHVEPWERLTSRVQKVQDERTAAKNITHQGVVGVTTTYSYATLDDLLVKAQNSERPAFFLILDHIQDPHNFGAILRSAECAGVHGVIIQKRNAAGITPTVMKVSAGAAAYIPVCRVTNLGTAIEKLKQAGVWIVGTAGTAQQQYTQVDLTVPVAIVIGNEEKGIRRLVAKKCDFLVSIPLAGKIESLNASVSSAIMLFEARRQRNCM